MSRKRCTRLLLAAMLLAVMALTCCGIKRSGIGTVYRKDKDCGCVTGLALFVDTGDYGIVRFCVDDVTYGMFLPDDSVEYTVVVGNNTATGVSVSRAGAEKE